MWTKMAENKTTKNNKNSTFCYIILKTYLAAFKIISVSFLFNVFEKADNKFRAV